MGRIRSIDALRGLAVAWLLGYFLIRPSGVLPATLHSQLEHGGFYDFRMADLGPPGFMMFSALGMCLSLSRRRAQGRGTGVLLFRLVRRSSLIFLLGIIVDAFGGLPLSQARWTGILQVLALGDLVAGLSVLFLPRIAQLGLWGLLLTAHWSLLSLGSMEGIAVSHVVHDHFPPGRVWPLSAVANSLSVLWLSRLLLREDCAYTSKAARVALVAAAACNLALVWSTILPVSRLFWTPSYSLLTSGISFAIFSGTIFAVDVLGLDRLANPFIVLGMNPLTALVLTVVSRFAIQRLAVPALTSVGAETWIATVWVGSALAITGVLFLLHNRGLAFRL